MTKTKINLGGKKKARTKKRIKKIKVNKKITDKEMNKLKGTFINNYSDYKFFDKSIEVYDENDKVLVKYYKKAIPIKLKKLALTNLKEVAILTNNRGYAAGPVDLKVMKKLKPNRKFKIVSKHKMIGIKEDGTESNFRLAMPAYGNIVGWYDAKDKKTKQTSIKETMFSKKNPQKFKNSFPFIQWVSNMYKSKVPSVYQDLEKKVKKFKKYVVPNTIFSTITVNKSFRTALHKDKGDYGELGNLSVLHNGSVKGGYLLFPQYKIGIKVGDRDFAIMNVHQWHTNTPITGKGERISFIMYLREGIVKKFK